MSVYRGACTVIATVGLPRSGKSTWAMDRAKSFGIPVVSLDAIRMALTGKVFDSAREPSVWDFGKHMVHSLFLAGHPVVIVDECNNTVDQRKNWKSEKWLTLWKHFDTPADICLARATETNEEYLIPVILHKAAEFEDLDDAEWRCGELSFLEASHDISRM